MEGKKKPPKHVAIIMDGNGRWAKERGLPRLKGHEQGIEALRRTVRATIDLKLEILTVFGFSTENWNRPTREVNGLMRLAKYFMKTDVDELHRAGVRLRVIGNRDGIDPKLRHMIDEAEKLTADNRQLTFVVAFNYGCRQEIARAVRRIAEKVAKGLFDPKTISAEMVQQHLYIADLPDPDLIIRTGGEIRLSNFLLWQSAYAELIFLDTLWPDFDRNILQQAIEEFQRRDRRFGCVKA